jgi:hypothetical protein
MWQCPKVYATSQIEHPVDHKVRSAREIGQAREIGIDAATFLAYSPIVSLYP